jgi:hypothetical protein
MTGSVSSHLRSNTDKPLQVNTALLDMLVAPRAGVDGCRDRVVAGDELLIAPIDELALKHVELGSRRCTAWALISEFTALLPLSLVPPLLTMRQ